MVEISETVRFWLWFAWNRLTLFGALVVIKVLTLGRSEADLADLRYRARQDHLLRYENDPAYRERCDLMTKLSSVADFLQDR